MYNFLNISRELEIGREIEFEYRKRKYSITNCADGYWYFYCDTTNTELMKICRFEDKESLIKLISKYKIDDLTIEEIFNSDKYVQQSLCIL